MAIFKYILLLAISIVYISCREIPEEDKDQIKTRLESPIDEPLKQDKPCEEELFGKPGNKKEEHIIQDNEKGLLNKPDINEKEHVRQDNGGLFDMQSDKDENEHVINLKINLNLENYEKEEKGSVSPSNYFKKPFDWESVSNLFTRCLISKNERESQDESLEVESPKRLRRSPNKQNIKKELDIIYKLILNLVEIDQNINNAPLVFLNTLFPFLKEFVGDTSNLNVNKAIQLTNELLKVPLIRDFIAPLRGFLKLANFIFYGIQKQLEFLQIFGIYDLEENKVLAKNYKEALNSFIEIVREDLKQNYFPAGTLEFIWDKSIEMILLIKDISIFPQRVSSRVKRATNLNNSKSKENKSSDINSNIRNILEYFDMNSKSKRNSDISSNVQFVLEYLDEKLKETKRKIMGNKPSYMDISLPTENKNLRKFRKAKSSANY